MLLEANNLCFSYYKKPLCLKDVFISLKKGQKIFVVGTKDSGKTTLLKVLSGFDNTYFGSVKLNDEEIKKIPDESRNVSLIFSEPVLLKSKTIKQNFNFFFEVTKRDVLSDDKLTKLINQFGINRDLNEKVKKLSISEKRKLCLLRSILKNPDIIFLDDQFKDLSDDEIEGIKNIYKTFFEDKILSIIFALNEESFLKNKDFFCDLKVDDIVFLSQAKAYHYNSFDEMFEQAPTLDAVKFRDDLELKELKIVFKNGEYFLFADEAYFFKFDKAYNSIFSKLELDELSEESVIVATNKQSKFSELNDNEFNKMIKNGEVYIFLKLDESRLI